MAQNWPLTVSRFANVTRGGCIAQREFTESLRRSFRGILDYLWGKRAAKWLRRCVIFFLRESQFTITLIQPTHSVPRSGFTSLSSLTFTGYIAFCESSCCTSFFANGNANSGRLPTKFVRSNGSSSRLYSSHSSDA